MNRRPAVSVLATRTSSPLSRAVRVGLILVFASLLVAAGCGGESPEPMQTDDADPPQAAPHGGHEPAQDPHAGHAPDSEQEPRHDPHADHASPGGGIVIPAEVARRMGVTLAQPVREDLVRTLRAPGEIVPDETRLSTVSLRFGGWAERLHVDHTGQRVHAGQPLLEVYSPELVSAQEDLLAALRLAEALGDARVPGSRERSDAMVGAARDRLRFWNVPEAEIRRVEETRETRPQLLLEAPSSGYVLEKAVQVGERFEAGTPLYRLADLSRVWLEIEVYERDLPALRIGMEVEVQLSGPPGGMVRGRTTWIDPRVDRDRRTVRARIELPNPDGHLRPGMYGTARAHLTVARDALTVPRDAVMFSGERTLVFVALGADRYEVRPVRIGAEAGDRIQILEGLAEGEPVVARAGFLLDSESRLMEAMMGQPGMPGMDMDMPGMEMDPMDMPGMEGMEMDGPGMDTSRMDGPGADVDAHEHDGGPDA